MNVETWPIEKVVEYARNPRKNDAAVVETVHAGRVRPASLPVKRGAI